jgi:hypothetical protein
VRALVGDEKSRPKTRVIEQGIDPLLTKRRLGLIQPGVRSAPDEPDCQLRVVSR